MVGTGLECATLTASLELSVCTWKEREGEEGRGGEGRGRGWEGGGEGRGTDGFSFIYWSFMERVLAFLASITV